MSIQIGAVGIEFAPQELPQGSRGLRQAQIRLVEQKLPEIKKEYPAVSDKSLALMQGAARDLEQISLAFNRRLKFVVDHKSHEVTIKVIDPQTDKVIKELPPEKIQWLRDRIRETIGVLFDEQV